MKIYNKFVESKKEPQNKNDIWFDGEVFKIYKAGEWQAFTFRLEDANAIIEITRNFVNYYNNDIKPTVIEAQTAASTIKTYVDLAIKAAELSNKNNETFIELNSQLTELSKELNELIELSNTAITAAQEAAILASNQAALAQKASQSANEATFNANEAIANINNIITSLENILNKKANIEGHYPELTSGFADNLVGRGEAIPAEFSFRASGGKSIEDGTARIKTLHGNAAVWNQMQNNVEGITFKNTTKTVTNNKYELMANTSSMAGNIYQENYRPELIANHRYIIMSDCINSRGEEPKINIGSYYGVINKVFTAPSDGGCYFFPFGTSTQINVGDTATFSHIKVHDLTKMFGTGNEPITIEDFNARKPIVEDENAYNEGEVIPFTAEGVKSIGDNAWDEEWEVGAFNADGSPTTSAGIRSKNMFHVVGGEQYYIYGETKAGSLYAWFYFYDRDMNFIGRKSAYLPSSTDSADYDNPVTAPTNAAFAKFYVSQTYGSTYNHDITISLYHSGWKTEVDAKYKPYEQDIRKIDQRILDAFPNGMMPWDKVYNKNGKGYIVKGTGKVDLGTLNWIYLNDNQYFYITEPEVVGIGMAYNPDVVKPSNLICDRYVAAPTYNTDGLDKVMSGPYKGAFSGRFMIKDTNYTDAASFKSAMAGVPLYYELAEPTIIEYDEPFNLDYLVWDFGTEEILANGASAPLKADIIYQFNAVDEIRELRQLIATMQAQLANMTINN